MKKFVATILCLCMLFPLFCFGTSATSTSGVTYENLMNYGLISSSVFSSGNKAPTIDGSADADEYVQMIDLTNSIAYSSTPAVNADLLPDYVHMYMNYDENNLYFALVIQEDELVTLNSTNPKTGNATTAVQSFAKIWWDFSGTSLPSAPFPDDYNTTLSMFEKNPTAKTISDHLDSGYYYALYKGSAITNYEFINDICGGRATDIGGKNYTTYEFSISKQVIKQIFGVEDISTFTFRVELRNARYRKSGEISPNNGYQLHRVTYGMKVTSDIADATGLPITTNQATVIPFYVTLGDDSQFGLRTYELGAYNQQTYYANTATTAANVIDGNVTSGEYALTHSIAQGGAGVIRGSYGYMADSINIGVDYDSDYIYLSATVKDPSPIAKNEAADGTYDATSAEAAKYDVLYLNFGFDIGNGVSRNAMKEIQLALYAEATGTAGAAVSGYNYKADCVTMYNNSPDIINSVAGSDTTYYTGKIVSVISGKYDTAQGAYVYELKLDKSFIAEAFFSKKDASLLSNTFFFRLRQQSTILSSGAKASAHGLKFWTGLVTADGAADTASNQPIRNAFLRKYGASFTSLTHTAGYGHLVVLGGKSDIINASDYKIGKIKAYDLAEYNQQTYYANRPTKANNTINGVIADGEYAMTHKVQKLGAGVIRGTEGYMAEYIDISVDYDSEYIYLAAVIKDSTPFARYETASKTYSASDNNYDYLNLMLGFDIADGSSTAAMRELRIKLYAEAKGSAGAAVTGYNYKSDVTTLNNNSVAVINNTAGSDTAYYNGKVVNGLYGVYNASLGAYVYELKLDKSYIAEAFFDIKDASKLSNTFYFRFQQQSVILNASGAKDSKHGLKFWTGKITADGAAHTTFNSAIRAAMTAAYGTSFTAQTTIAGYGHIIVLGDVSDIEPVRTNSTASVKLGGESAGLRFTTEINKDYYDALVAEYGANNVKVGTLIAPVSYLNRASDFTKEGLSALDLGNGAGNYLDVTADAPYSSDDNVYVYSASVVDIADYELFYAARGYIEITNGDTVETVWSNTYSVRNVMGVAESAAKDTSSIPNTVYDYSYLSEMSYPRVFVPYSDEDYRTILEFATGIRRRASENDIRIASNNVYFWERMGLPIDQRCEILFDSFTYFDADVLLLQEVSEYWHTTMDDDLVRMGYTVVPTAKANVSGAEQNDNYTPIWYRADRLELLDYGYDQFNSVSYRPDGDMSSSKSYTWALFRDKNTNSTFATVSTHFTWAPDTFTPTPNELRKMDAQEIADLVTAIRGEYGNIPITVMGDLNCGVGGDPYNIIGTVLDDARLTVSNNHNLNYGTSHTVGMYPTKGGGKIDHTFISDGNMNAKQFQYAVNYWSVNSTDHIPMLLDVELTPTPITGMDDPAAAEQTWNGLR